MPEVFTVDMGRAMSEGARIVNSNLGLFIGYALVSSLIYFAVTSVATAIGGMVVVGPIAAGYFIAAFRIMRGEPVDFSNLFEPWKDANVYLYSLVTRLIILVAALIGIVPIVLGIISLDRNHQALGVSLLLLALPLLIPALYLIVSYQIGLPMIVDRHIGFWPAAEVSRKTTGRAWFSMAAFLIVMWVITAVGAMVTCFLGLLWLTPWLAASTAVIYRDNFADLTPLRIAPLPYAPPPPGYQPPPTQGPPPPRYPGEWRG